MLSNSFRLLRGTIPFDIKSNEPFSKFLQLLVISKFLSDAFRENVNCVFVGGGGGNIHRPITLNLIKDSRNSDYQSNEPPSKFILSPFLYKFYIPPGHKLQPFS